MLYYIFFSFIRFQSHFISEANIWLKRNYFHSKPDWGTNDFGFNCVLYFDLLFI